MLTGGIGPTVHFVENLIKQKRVSTLYTWHDCKSATIRQRVSQSTVFDMFLLKWYLNL